MLIFYLLLGFSFASGFLASGFLAAPLTSCFAVCFDSKENFSTDVFLLKDFVDYLKKTREFFDPGIDPLI